MMAIITVMPKNGSVIRFRAARGNGDVLIVQKDGWAHVNPTAATATAMNLQVGDLIEVGFPDDDETGIAFLKTDDPAKALARVYRYAHKAKVHIKFKAERASDELKPRLPQRDEVWVSAGCDGDGIVFKCKTRSQKA